MLFFTDNISSENDIFLSQSSTSIGHFTALLLSTLITSLVIDEFGRRLLLILSLSGLSATYIIEGTYFYLKKFSNHDMSNFNLIPFATLIINAILNGIGIRTVFYVVLSEIFATDIKDVAMTLITNYYLLVATLIPEFFFWSITSFGMHLTFLVFAVCCIFGVFFVVTFVPETKKKSLEDIQTELRFGSDRTPSYDSIDDEEFTTLLYLSKKIVSY